MGRVVPAVVIFVSDMERVSRFYREVAAMDLVSGNDSHQVLGIEGFQLVIHKIHGEPEGAEGAAPREDSYIKICLPVGSFAEARKTAGALGGFVKGAEFEWEARGFRACDGNDPEGNIIQVRVPA